MKKLLTMVLASVLLLCTFAGAEGSNLANLTLPELQSLYGDVLAEIMKRTVVKDVSDIPVGEKEITFRGVPWGTDPLAYLELMASAGITGTIRAATGYNSPESWEWRLDDDLERMIELKDAGYYVSSTTKNLMVAGFPVTSVSAYFLHTADEENVYTEQEKSVFYRADYTFEVVDVAGTYQILKSKLSGLYGEGTESSDSTSWRSSRNSHEYVDATVWYGANDTAVVLWRNYQIYDDDGTYQSDTVKLSYGRSNSIAMMQELKAAMAREQLEEAANSMDGL